MKSHPASTRKRGRETTFTDRLSAHPRRQGESPASRSSGDDAASSLPRGKAERTATDHNTGPLRRVRGTRWSNPWNHCLSKARELAQDRQQHVHPGKTRTNAGLQVRCAFAPEKCARASSEVCPSVPAPGQKCVRARPGLPAPDLVRACRPKLAGAWRGATMPGKVCPAKSARAWPGLPRPGLPATVQVRATPCDSVRASPGLPAPGQA